MGVETTPKTTTEWKRLIQEAVEETPIIKKTYQNTEYMVAYRESLKTSYFVSIVASISGLIALIYGLVIYDLNIMFISGSIFAPSIVTFLKARNEIKRC